MQVFVSRAHPNLAVVKFEVVPHYSSRVKVSFPPLVVVHPEIAKSMVMFCYRTLEAAQTNAWLNGYQGAMYPWESDELGQETTPKFAYQNALYEIHVTGDVELAQWQYYLATGGMI